MVEVRCDCTRCKNSYPCESRTGFCRFFEPTYETQADSIRKMTDDELANLLTNFSNNAGWDTETGRQICYETILSWLKQENYKV